MMIGFWILFALFIAGLWWLGRSNGWMRRCECVAVPAGRDRNGEGKRLPGGDYPGSAGSFSRK